jgi:hypothetical protein
MGPSADLTPLETSKLRKFGWSLGLLLAVIFGGLLPYILNFQYPLWPWLVTISLITIAEVAPSRLATVHKYWFQLAEIAHNIFNPILLGLIFFGLVFPIGAVKRGLGKSKLQLKLDPNAASYREPPVLSEDLRDPF